MSKVVPEYSVERRRLLTVLKANLKKISSEITFLLELAPLYLTYYTLNL
jgi:hypothetical protein